MGWGTDRRPVWARTMMPGRARNSIQTPAAMAPKSENKKRLRANSSEAGSLPDAIHNATVVPSTQPARPDKTVTASERRTPNTRPMNAPASSANTNAGTSKHSSPPSWSNTEAPTAGVIERNRARRLPELLDGELTVGVLGPQHLLVELADTGLGHLVDERPAFGKLPPRHEAREELAQL